MRTPLDRSPLAKAFGVVKTLVVAAVALGGLGLFLAWMGGAFHEKVPPGSVAVERPSAKGRALVAAKKDVGTKYFDAVGSVQSRRKTDVASQLLAKIVEVKPRPGDRVKANDAVIVLDDRDLVAQQREAAATLASAEADLAIRAADLRRMKAAGAAASADEVAKVQGAFTLAEAQVKRVKEAITRIDVQLTYTKIGLRSDGVVSERLMEPGDLAVPGKPILTVYDPTDLELHVSVPESLATGIAVGQTCDIRIDAANLPATVPVREVVPQADSTSRSVLVKFALPTPTNVTLLPGMYGRAKIPSGSSMQVHIPPEAVQRVGQLDLVELVLDDGTLSRRFVRVGRLIKTKVDDRDVERLEILSGLADGDRVALPALPAK